MLHLLHRLVAQEEFFAHDVHLSRRLDAYARLAPRVFKDSDLNPVTPAARRLLAT
jgi:hypothetical protein